MSRTFDEGMQYLIRDVKKEDINDMMELSGLLNTINLPANTDELLAIIDQSEKSFSLKEENPEKRAFLFVLVSPQGKLIGTSQIFAKHGTKKSPHNYFKVDYEERYSETLNRYFHHRTLQFMQSFDGPTMIGSLVLDPSYRLKPQKLGKTLSFVRFLFISMNPQFFAEKIIAELLPPLGPNFESALWEAVGRKFTGLDYYEADMLSRKNKEFIKNLFPSGKIYVSLLSEEAQKVIGEVGSGAKGAAHLLEKIGFRYCHCVDPFDGGPHFLAEKNSITLIKQTIKGKAARLSYSSENRGLLGSFTPYKKSGHRFRAIISPYDKQNENIYISNLGFEALELLSGEEVSLIPF